MDREMDIPVCFSYDWDEIILRLLHWHFSPVSRDVAVRVIMFPYWPNKYPKIIQHINYKYSKENSCCVELTEKRDFMQRIDNLFYYFLILLTTDFQILCLAPFLWNKAKGSSIISQPSYLSLSLVHTKVNVGSKRESYMKFYCFRYYCRYRYYGKIRPYPMGKLLWSTMQCDLSQFLKQA